MANNNYQKGTALISALLVTAMVLVLSMAMAISLHFIIHKAQRITSNDQIELVLQGVNDWAKTVILNQSDLTKVKPLKLEIKGIHVVGQIHAQQGLFNLNSLVNAENEIRFIRLLQAALPNMTTAKANGIARAVNAWISPGGSDEDYFRSTPPYRAAHRSLTLVSELRAVRGITASLYLTLAPYLTALPSDQYKVDINNAPLPVWQTLSDAVTLSKAKALRACQAEHGYFNTVDEFLRYCGASTALSADNITTAENFFIVQGQAHQGKQRLMMSSLLKKQLDQNGKISIKIVWQEFNAE